MSVHPLCVAVIAPGVVMGTGQTAPLESDQTGLSGPPSGVGKATSPVDCHVRQPSDSQLLSGSSGGFLDDFGGMMAKHMTTFVAGVLDQNT